MNAQVFLSQFNITVDAAAAYVASKANDIQGLFSTLRAVGMNTAILTEVVQNASPAITSSQVREFFKTQGLETIDLDKAYFDQLRNKLAPQILGNQNDTISGTENADYIDAGIGNDTINGLGGDDLLVGGSGDDRLNGGWGADYLEGGLGADVLDAGRLLDYRSTNGYYQGNQWVPSKFWTEYDQSSNQLIGGGGADKLHGGFGADILDGGDGSDYIEGREGNDSIFGGVGDDTIYGNWWGYYPSDIEDDDQIDGGDGNDEIYGGSGKDVIAGGNGNDRIYANQTADVDAGAGDDRVEISFFTGAKHAGVFKGGDGSDVFRLSRIESGNKVVIDLTENVSSKDAIQSWSAATGLVEPVVVIHGFQKGFDQFEIGNYDALGLSGGLSSSASVNWQGLITANYAQIVQSPNDLFKTRLSSPKTPDDYGKGIFVIQGATVANDDIVTVAQFLDHYGNNHMYGKSVAHRFLVNVGTTDMALYAFKDDTGADNNVVADELTPIARFVGVQTEQLSTTDLANIFI